MLNFIFTLVFFFICNIGNSQIQEAVNAQVVQKDGLTTEQSELIYLKVRTFPNNTQISITIISKSNANY